MPGSSNFQQWNPAQANQENDSAYTADSLRAGGATTDAIFSSPLANKLFYQLSTFIKAMADSLVAKGYTLSDANEATLAAVLGNLVTQADLSVLNLNQSLYRSNNLASHTGTVTKDTMFSYNLLAGQVLPNSIIRVTLWIFNSLVSGNNTLYLLLGSSSTPVSLNMNGQHLVEFDLVMPGVVTTENLLEKIIINEEPISIFSVGGLGVDLTAGATLSIAVQATNSGNLFQIQSALVQLL